MAKKVLKDPFFEVNSTDLSSYVSSVTIDYDADTPEATASGDDTHVMLPNGLHNWTIEVALRQDYASSKVDATLFSLVGKSAGTIKVRPSQSAVATDNPEYTGDGILQSYNPVEGGVGEVQTPTATFVPDGSASSPTLARATS